MSNGWGGKRTNAGRKPKYPRVDILCQVAKNNPCPHFKSLLTLARSSDPAAARSAAELLRDQFGVALHVPSAPPDEQPETNPLQAQAQAPVADNSCTGTPSDSPILKKLDSTILKKSDSS